jgi:sRNA-binding carbon storage regulator CsrA
VIDRRITVDVIAVHGHRVRPGIEAPVEIKVLRDEPVAERETALARGKTDDRPVVAAQLIRYALRGSRRESGNTDGY